MFISMKRHEREKQELIGISNRLTEAVLRSSDQGLFLLDPASRIVPPVSQSLAALFRRQDFTDLTFEKLLSPIVTAKTLTMVKSHMAELLSAAAPAPLGDIDVRLPNPDGSFDTAHYAFAFDPICSPNEPRAWLVRITDTTTRVNGHRELEELRSQVQTQAEVLRGVLRLGSARFAGLMRNTDASMKTIATVLKKPARETEAFRLKLEEILYAVDRIRREAADFGLTALEHPARIFEDALQDLRSRSGLSGSDFLPLAVKLDQLYDQFALVQSLTTFQLPVRESDATPEGPRTTQDGAQLLEVPGEAPKAGRLAESTGSPIVESKPLAATHGRAPVGSLDRTLQALTDHVAQACDKQVTLESKGLHLVPPKYQAAIKNVAIQLIRNAVMHGIEPPAAREAAGKPSHGRLRLEFTLQGENFEFMFEDDGRGLVADEVRSTAIARGVVTAEAAARMRDREAIKLIFKSRYTTLSRFTGAGTHGAGMAVVRRYVQDAGGKIALASLPGRETRFKITLPLLPETPADVQPATEVL